MPDLLVDFDSRLDRLQIVGLSGLNFPVLFEDIHSNVPSMRLRLVPLAP